MSSFEQNSGGKDILGKFANGALKLVDNVLGSISNWFGGLFGGSKAASGMASGFNGGSGGGSPDISSQSSMPDMSEMAGPESPVG